MCSPDPKLTENSRINLLEMTKLCAFTQLLVPPVDSALHDHDYVKKDSPSIISANRFSVLSENFNQELQPPQMLPAEVKKKLNVTLAERANIEEITRNQSSLVLC